MCGKSEVLILCVKNLWPLWKYILEVRFFYPSFRLLLPFCLKFTIHERKVELFERLLRKAACNAYFRFSYVWVSKGLHFFCIDRVCCSHLNFESFTTPSPTSRRASELEGSAYKGHRSLHRVPGGCLISSTFIRLIECGISPLWSIFIVSGQLCHRCMDCTFDSVRHLIWKVMPKRKHILQKFSHLTRLV